MDTVVAYKKFASLEERFWSKVNKTDGCWFWTAGTIGGYGNFNYKSKYTSAHKFSFFLSGRSLEEGECVLHTCDNRLCVKPDHLYAGTRSKNGEDAAIRGRLKTVLSPDKVREARELRCEGLGLQEIADRVSASKEAVRRAIKGESWKHV